MSSRKPSFEVKPIAGTIGAEIFGVDLTQELNAYAFNEIHETVVIAGLKIPLVSGTIAQPITMQSTIISDSADTCSEFQFTKIESECD